MQAGHHCRSGADPGKQSQDLFLPFLALVLQPAQEEVLCTGVSPAPKPRPSPTPKPSPSPTHKPSPNPAPSTSLTVRAGSVALQPYAPRGQKLCRLMSSDGELEALKL